MAGAVFRPKESPSARDHEEVAPPAIGKGEVTLCGGVHEVAKIAGLHDDPIALTVNERRAGGRRAAPREAHGALRTESRYNRKRWWAFFERGLDCGARLAVRFTGS